jgi:tRNA 2-selenouridine synthase
VEVDADERIALLREDYDHLFETPEFFKTQLAKLVPLHGHAVVGAWHALLDQDQRDELFRELIERHYDPTYARSGRRQFGGLPQALSFPFHPMAPDVTEQAQALLNKLES